MKAFTTFLNSLGGLHDAMLISFEWRVDEKILKFQFADLYANFRDMPEYPGKTEGTIILRGVVRTEISIDSEEPMRVFEFLPVDSRMDQVMARFSPSGKIVATYQTADFPESLLGKKSVT